MKGIAELDPQVAVVDASLCTSCGACVESCPFGAISLDGVALIDAAGCKGCGGCVPVCAEDAIDLQGYTDGQVRAMIDSLLTGAVA